jgi:hypothetical protein
MKASQQERVDAFNARKEQVMIGHACDAGQLPKDLERKARVNAFHEEMRKQGVKIKHS